MLNIACSSPSSGATAWIGLNPALSSSNCSWTGSAISCVKAVAARTEFVSRGALNLPLLHRSSCRTARTCPWSLSTGLLSCQPHFLLQLIQHGSLSLGRTCPADGDDSRCPAGVAARLRVGEWPNVCVTICRQRVQAALFSYSHHRHDGRIEQAGSLSAMSCSSRAS
jgi:hypothetical protein